MKRETDPLKLGLVLGTLLTLIVMFAIPIAIVVHDVQLNNKYGKVLYEIHIIDKYETIEKHFISGDVPEYHVVYTAMLLNRPNDTLYRKRIKYVETVDSVSYANCRVGKLFRNNKNSVK